MQKTIAKFKGMQSGGLRIVTNLIKHYESKLVKLQEQMRFIE